MLIPKRSFSNRECVTVSSQLVQLKEITSVVADTVDFEAVSQYQPVDVTTNPTLVFKTLSSENSRALILESLRYAKQKNKTNLIELACDWLTVQVGRRFFEVISGAVSTEVDACLSFDVDGTVKKANQLLELYDIAGCDTKRVLIKIAATWEGIKAAELLEKSGIRCNLTLVFSHCQAQACAEAGVYLISPFVGRITDWYSKQEQVNKYIPEEDPGVQSVTQIYNYYKRFGYKTKVMGASFRNIEQIQQLAGCDYLTIPPQFLGELAHTNEKLVRKLFFSTEVVEPSDILFERDFRWLQNEDAMATEKLAEGIRFFFRDQKKLQELVATCLTNKNKL